MSDERNFEQTNACDLRTPNEEVKNPFQGIIDFFNAEPDMVNHPPHYQIGGIETFEIIKTMLTREELIGYLKGQILKYRERAAYKGHQEEDWAKARWYYERLQEENE